MSSEQRDGEPESAAEFADWIARAWMQRPLRSVLLARIEARDAAVRRHVLEDTADAYAELDERDCPCGVDTYGHDSGCDQDHYNWLRARAAGENAGT